MDTESKVRYVRESSTDSSSAEDSWKRAYSHPKLWMAFLLGLIAALAAAMMFVAGVENCNVGTHMLMVLPCILIGVFFLYACTQAEKIIERNGNNMFGIYTLVGLSLIMLLINAVTTIPVFARKRANRLRRVKPNVPGCLLVLGAGAIVFGFLDNYGMKLGTEALEDGLFWRLGTNALGKGVVLNTDGQEKSLAEALGEFNKFFTETNTNIKDLFKAENGYSDENAGKIINHYMAIKDSSSMLGNTFSDFVGALLGAGIGGLFTYVTAIDGDVDGGWGFKILQNPVTRVILEACFIAMGCLIPVGMHFRSKASELGVKVGRWLPLLPNWAFLGLNGAILFVLMASQLFLDKQKGVSRDDASVDDDEGHAYVSAAGVGVMVLVMALMIYRFRAAAAK